MKKILLPLVFSVIIFFLAILVWYSPILFKNYSASTANNIETIARNFSLTNVYGAESKLNVVLATSLVKDQARPAGEANKLGTLLYGYIFKVFGAPQSQEGMVFYSVLILALTLVVFFISVVFLFDLMTAIIFSLIFIFFPSNWLLPTSFIGIYEIPLLFLSLFWLLFVLGVYNKNQGAQENIAEPKKIRDDWPYYLMLVFSGIFLALAGMAKDALLLFAPILFIFLLIKARYRLMVSIFLPFFVVISLLWLPSFIGGNNEYLLFFLPEKQGVAKQGSDFAFYAHLYPDPYTFYFDREEFDKEYNARLTSADLMGRIGNKKVAVNMGQESISLVGRLIVGTSLLIRYFGRLVSLEDMGGPLIFFILILGLVYLRRQKSSLFTIFSFWIVGFIFLLSYINLVIRNHFMDFGFI